MQVLSARSLSLNISRAREGQSRSVRGAEVRGPSEEPRDVLRERVQRLARGVSTGDALCVGRKNRQVTIPPFGEFPPLHQFDFVSKLGILGTVRLEQPSPFAP